MQSAGDMRRDEQIRHRIERMPVRKRFCFEHIDPECRESIRDGAIHERFDRHDRAAADVHEIRALFAFGEHRRVKEVMRLRRTGQAQGDDVRRRELGFQLTQKADPVKLRRALPRSAAHADELTAKGAHTLCKLAAEVACADDKNTLPSRRNDRAEIAPLRGLLQIIIPRKLLHHGKQHRDHVFRDADAVGAGGGRQDETARFQHLRPGIDVRAGGEQLHPFQLLCRLHHRKRRVSDERIGVPERLRRDVRIRAEADLRFPCRCAQPVFLVGRESADHLNQIHTYHPSEKTTEQTAPASNDSVPEIRAGDADVLGMERRVFARLALGTVVFERAHRRAAEDDDDRHVDDDHERLQKVGGIPGETSGDDRADEDEQRAEETPAGHKALAGIAL